MSFTTLSPQTGGRLDAISLAEAALQESACQELADLECCLVEDVLIISGTVSSYYFKQLAQTAIEFHLLGGKASFHYHRLISS